MFVWMLPPLPPEPRYPFQCAQCGLRLTQGELCRQHPQAQAADWAEGNRIFCNWLHRGIVPRAH